MVVVRGDKYDRVVFGAPPSGESLGVVRLAWKIRLVEQSRPNPATSTTSTPRPPCRIAASRLRGFAASSYVLLHRLRGERDSFSTCDFGTVRPRARQEPGLLEFGGACADLPVPGGPVPVGGNCIFRRSLGWLHDELRTPA